MKRERYPSEEDVLDVCGSLVSGPLAESSIDKSENIRFVDATCVSSCNRAVLARTTALSDFAPSSRVHSSDVSDAVPIVRDAEQCGPKTKSAFSGKDCSSGVLYKLPNGLTVNLKGCRLETRGGAAVIISPQGDEYISMQDAYEALQLEQQGSHGHGRSCALKAMSITLADLVKEGNRATCPVRTTIHVPQEINAEAADVAPKPTHGNAEISCLTALQSVSQRMESEAGLSISSEILAFLDDGSFFRLDELGRERLRSLCTEFHNQCLKSFAQGTEWCYSKFVY
jgi:hypothetical protein